MFFHKVNLKFTIYYLILIFLFLLPWQTRLIFDPQFLNGGFWEYGSGSLYATELIAWLIIILFAIDQFRRPEFWQQARKRKLVYLIISLLVVIFLITEVIRSNNSVVSYYFAIHLIEAVCLATIIARLSFRPQGEISGSIDQQTEI